MKHVQKSSIYFVLSAIVLVLCATEALLAGRPSNGFREIIKKLRAADRPAEVVNPCPSIRLEVTGAPWCGPCQKLKPILAKLEKQGYAIQDFESNSPNKATVPWLEFFRFDKSVKEISGGRSEEELIKIFRELEGSVF